MIPVFPDLDPMHTDLYRRTGCPSSTLGSTRTVHAVLVVVFLGLSLSLFLALAGVCSSLGLGYRVGYLLREIDLVILSRKVDSMVWLVVTGTTAIAALGLAAWSNGRERSCWVFYSLMAFVQIALFLGGRADVALWISLLFGSAFLASTAILAERLRMRTQPKGVIITVSGFLSILALVESLALISNFLIMTSPNLIIDSTLFLNSMAFQNQLSGLLFFYSPLLMLAAIFVWVPMLPLIFEIPSTEGKSDNDSRETTVHKFLTSRKISLALLVLASLWASVIPLLPYAIEPRLRGVDVSFYYDHLSSTASLSDAIAQLGVEPRAPYLLLLYGIRSLTGWDPHLTMMVGPAVLGVLFSLAVYLLTRQLSGDWLAAGIAALFAASSLHIAVGLFAGIYANWLGLSVAILFLYLLDKALTKTSTIVILLSILASYLVVFVHAWTWGIVIAATAVTLTLMIIGLLISREDRDMRNSVKTCAIVFCAATLPMLAAMIGLVNVLPGLREAIYNGLYEVAGSFSLSRLDDVIPTLTMTMNFYVGSLLAYPLILIIAVIGGVSMARSNSQHARPISAWLIVASVSAILLDSWFQWRVLYLVPFEVLAAIGIVFLFSTIDRAIRPNRLGSENTRLLQMIKLFLLIVVIMDFMNYSLRADLILP